MHSATSILCIEFLLLSSFVVGTTFIYSTHERYFTKATIVQDGHDEGNISIAHQHTCFEFISLLPLTHEF
jgi:hypothetical protein